MLENNELFTRIKEIRNKKIDIIHKVAISELHSKEDKYFLSKTLEGLQMEEYELLNKLKGDDF